MFFVELGPPALALGVAAGFPVISIPTSTPIGMPGHGWGVGSIASPTTGNFTDWAGRCCLRVPPEDSDRLLWLVDSSVFFLFVMLTTLACNLSRGHRIWFNGIVSRWIAKAWKGWRKHTTYDGEGPCTGAGQSARLGEREVGGCN